MNLTKIDGGVTAAAGFEAAGCEAGIKYQGRTDMAMIYCRVPCAAAGTFTSNVVKAAPVLYDRHIVTDIGKAQAIVINAGIERVIVRETPEEFTVYHTADWIENDDSLSGKFGY